MRCAAMQYNIALVLCLHREVSQRESYSDAQHRKILNRLRYKYRSQSFVHSGGYIYLRIIHTSIRKPMSQWPTFFLHYIIGRQRYAHIPVPKLRQQAIPGYIPFLLYIHTCVIHPRHTSPSLNITVAISRREIAKHFRSKQRVTKTRQQNTSTWQHGIILPRLIKKIKNCAPSPAANTAYHIATEQ